MPVSYLIPARDQRGVEATIKGCRVRIYGTLLLDIVEASPEAEARMLHGFPQAISVRRRAPESAQPCGCDPGANWVCAEHQAEAGG